MRIISMSKRNEDRPGYVKLIVRRVRKRGGGFIYPKPPKRALTIYVRADRILSTPNAAGFGHRDHWFRHRDQPFRIVITSAAERGRTAAG
jgi:hypothetical protein